MNSSNECIELLAEIAIANSPELVTIDEQIALIDRRLVVAGKRIDHTSNKRWTNYISSDPLRIAANILGGGDVQRDNIAIADPEYYFTAKSPEIKTLVSKCKGKKYKDVLGYPGKDPIKFVKKLFTSVGLEVRSRQITKNGKQIRVYCLDRERLSSNERLAIQRAIELKYEEKIDSPNQPLEWVEKDRENFARNPKIENGQKIAEAIWIQELQLKQITPNFLKKNQVDLLSKNSGNFLVNSTSEISNTDQLQSSLDSEESIRDLRGMLEQIESAEELAELTTIAGFTRERLNRAARLLPKAIYARVKQWAISVRRQSFICSPE